MIAGLSANHLAALDLPPSLRRLYVARDNDAAGRRAANVCANAPSTVSTFASSCRCMATSTSISAVSALTAFSHVSKDQLVPDDRVRFHGRRAIAQ